MNDSIIHTVRCKECPECRQITLYKGELLPRSIIEEMQRHVEREHGAVAVTQKGEQ